MKKFMSQILGAGCVPVAYNRRRIPDKNGLFIFEIEFRWKKYANSKHVQIKHAYNTSREDHHACMEMFRVAATHHKMKAVPDSPSQS